MRVGFFGGVAYFRLYIRLLGEAGYLFYHLLGRFGTLDVHFLVLLLVGVGRLYTSGIGLLYEVGGVFGGSSFLIQRMLIFVLLYFLLLIVSHRNVK